MPSSQVEQDLAFVETNTRRIIQRLTSEGWSNVDSGKHDVFKHSDHKTLVVVPLAASRNWAPPARSPKRRDGFEENAMTQYVGILEGDASGWSIRIPDVPGCHGAGGTSEEALSDAIGALRTVARLYAVDGIQLNAPRDVLAIRADKDADFNSSSETFVLVPALVASGKSARASVLVDTGALEAIDEAAERRGMTRSAFLTEVALATIERDAV